MNRRSIFTFCAVAALGLAVLPSNIGAQQGTLKQQLVGTWMLVSDEVAASNGTKRPFLSANKSGILVFDAGGRYVTVYGRSDRPKLKTVNRSELTAQELGPAALEFAASYGTWSVNEADKTITFHFELALVPNAAGVDAKVVVNLTGDELRLTFTEQPTGDRVDRAFRRAV